MTTLPDKHKMVHFHNKMTSFIICLHVLMIILMQIIERRNEYFCLNLNFLLYFIVHIDNNYGP